MNLRDALQDIYNRRGILTPMVVVDEARDPSHPLHSQFNWDDATAAEAHRREQAHQLIRKVRIVSREANEIEDSHTVRAWQPVRTERGHEYKPALEVAEDPFYRRMVLGDMKREWETLRRRYERFAEFSDMVRRDLEERAS